MDFRSRIITGFNKFPPIVKTFGMVLSVDEDGNPVITLPYNPNLDHGEGAIHGGAIATVLDNVGWITSALAAEAIVATSEMSLHLLRPARKVKLMATANVLKKGNNQVISEMFCKDENENLIAHATGTYIIMKNRK